MTPPIHPKLLDREWLVETYITKKRTMDEIASEIGASRSAVARALRRNGIDRRKTISSHPLLNDKEWLVDAYVNQKLSTTEIARLAGSTDGNVCWMLKHGLGIELRTIGDANRLARDRRVKSGKRGANWKGGKVKTAGGYIEVYSPNHPRGGSNNYVAEHIIVMEGVLGRFLEQGEVVHHIDGDKQNNDPGNLVVMRRDEHRLLHKNALLRLAVLENELRRYKERFGPLDS